MVGTLNGRASSRITGLLPDFVAIHATEAEQIGDVHEILPHPFGRPFIACTFIAIRCSG